MIYIYQKKVNAGELKSEISRSPITVALDYINATESQAEIVFKDSLSPLQVETLDSIVASHVFTLDEIPPLEVSVVSQPGLEPFAVPTFRTKWDATPNTIVMSESSTETIDYRLPEELYVHGGEILFTGAKIGDFLTASIVDKDGLIPTPYRADLAENYPVIASYIKRHYIPDGNGFQTIQTYPLNAKVTLGLYLRVTVVTCSKPGEREFAMNYYLTKKL